MRSGGTRPTGGRFPKIRGTFFSGPYNKDPSIWGTLPKIRVPSFGVLIIRILLFRVLY